MAGQNEGLPWSSGVNVCTRRVPAGSRPLRPRWDRLRSGGSALAGLLLALVLLCSASAGPALALSLPWRAGSTRDLSGGGLQRAGMPLQEVSVPEPVRQLQVALAGRQPVVEILSPTDGSVLDGSPWSLRLRVHDWPLVDAGPGGPGPHLVVQLDQEPPRIWTSLEGTMPPLSPGSHRLTVYAAMPWGEALRSPGAWRQIRVHRTAANPLALPDPDSPQLLPVSPRPQAGEEPLLLDWLLLNAPLQQLRGSVEPWRVRVEINGDAFLLDQQTPLWLRGWRPGVNALRLELLDARGEPMNPPFNSLVLEVERSATAPRSRWLGERLSPAELEVMLGRAPFERPAAEPEVEAVPGTVSQAEQPVPPVDPVTPGSGGPGTPGAVAPGSVAPGSAAAGTPSAAEGRDRSALTSTRSGLAQDETAPVGPSAARSSGPVSAGAPAAPGSPSRPGVSSAEELPPAAEAAPPASTKDRRPPRDGSETAAAAQGDADDVPPLLPVAPDARMAEASEGRLSERPALSDDASAPGGSGAAFTTGVDSAAPADGTSQGPGAATPSGDADRDPPAPDLRSAQNDSAAAAGIGQPPRRAGWDGERAAAPGSGEPVGSDADQAGTTRDLDEGPASAPLTPRPDQAATEDRLAPASSLGGRARDLVAADGTLRRPEPRGPLQRLSGWLQR